MHPHISVLLNEVLDLFNEKELEFFIDGTLGLGGHSEGILKAHPEIKNLIGIDQDENALKYAENRLSFCKEKVIFAKGNFKDIAKIAAEKGISQVDGILLDIGVSSIQLDQPDRGFSFMRDGPLDMRMDTTADLTAEQIVNTWPESDLVSLFWKYGEEPQSKRAARIIVEARKQNPIQTTLQLASLLAPLVPKYKQRINPATLVFQALRIAVNDELGVLQQILPAALKLLKPNGILAIITFHSLEDRIVKEYFRDQASDKVSTSGIGGMFLDKEPAVKILTRKPTSATDEEIAQNPRSRSAKLRAIEKI
ncbi:MAG: 16S rRNA (cytosine(1402)-N(4))-methyltransferase RsmH [Parachlamydiales bacterium]